MLFQGIQSVGSKEWICEWKKYLLEKQVETPRAIYFFCGRIISMISHRLSMKMLEKTYILGDNIENR